MIATIREQLLRGDLLLGAMVSLPSPEVTEILAQVGFDWLFVDAEHSALDALAIQALLQAAGAQMPCLVRLPSDDEAALKKALDCGAAGIIVPQVNTPEQAERVVRMSRYPPLGLRGVGVGRANGYGMRLREYLDSANERLAVVVQAEHVEAVRNIDAIARVPGLDAIFVGPYDLSASMGLTGQVDHPDVVAAIEQVAAACRAAGVRTGIFGASPSAVRPWIERGFTLVVGAVDTLLLAQSALAALGKLRVAAPDPGAQHF